MHVPALPSRMTMVLRFVVLKIITVHHRTFARPSNMFVRQ